MSVAKPKPKKIHNSQSEQRKRLQGANENSRFRQATRLKRRKSYQVLNLIGQRSVRVFWTNHRARNKAKTKQSAVIFETQLKVALLSHTNVDVTEFLIGKTRNRFRTRSRV